MVGHVCVQDGVDNDFPDVLPCLPVQIPEDISLGMLCKKAVHGGYMPILQHRRVIVEPCKFTSGVDQV